VTKQTSGIKEKVKQQQVTTFQGSVTKLPSFPWWHF